MIKRNFGVSLSILIIAISQLTGCATNVKSKEFTPADLRCSDLVITGPPSLLSEKEVTRDSSLLVYALTTAYGGRGRIPSDFFPKAINQLEQIHSPTTPAKLRDEIDEALLIIPDNHLKARLDGKMSPARLLVTKKGVVGKNAIKDADSVWEVRSEKFDGKRVLFIAITRFPSHKDPVWSGFIESVESKLRNSDLIVLDLRGNSGGDDTKGYDLATLLLGHQTVSPVEKEFFSQTPESFIIAGNGYRLAKSSLTARKESIPAYLDELINEQDQKFILASKGEIAAERVEIHIGDHLKSKAVNYNKPIFILMDGACASSCESSIYALETHPRVQKIGQSTGGYLHFGDIGQLVLPNSRVIVQIPTKADEYFDHRFVEREGIQPDIMVPSGQDAYKFLFAHKELLTTPNGR